MFGFYFESVIKETLNCASHICEQMFGGKIFCCNNLYYFLQVCGRCLYNYELDCFLTSKLKKDMPNNACFGLYYYEETGSDLFIIMNH